MDPGTIDLSFVPRRRAGLHPVAVGDEVLIVDDRADRPHLLSPTAALVWSFIDGRGSLGDFAADLVAVLGADPAQVQADLVGLARDLDQRGLLAGAERDRFESGNVAGPGNAVLTSPANPALDARFDRDDAHTTTVRDGALELDVRADDAALAEELAAGLGGAGLATDPPRPVSDRGPAPLYSVLLGRVGGPVTGLHLVYRSGRPLRRCRHRDDLVRIVVADVAAVLDRETGRRPLLDAVGLTRHGRRVAVDPLFAAVVSDLEPRLRSRGVARADASFLDLAPDGGDVLAGLVLRPSSGSGIGSAATPGSIALGAVDLTRGVDGRVAVGCLARLGDVVATTTIRRVPGRAALEAEVLDLLG